MVLPWRKMAQSFGPGAVSLGDGPAVEAPDSHVLEVSVHDELPLCRQGDEQGQRCDKVPHGLVGWLVGWFSI